VPAAHLAGFQIRVLRLAFQTMLAATVKRRVLAGADRLLEPPPLPQREAEVVQRRALAVRSRERSRLSRETCSMSALPDVLMTAVGEHGRT
jgi:hypothetical protein